MAACGCARKHPIRAQISENATQGLRNRGERVSGKASLQQTDSRTCCCAGPACLQPIDVGGYGGSRDRRERLRHMASDQYSAVYFTSVKTLARSSVEHTHAHKHEIDTQDLPCCSEFVFNIFPLKMKLFNLEICGRSQLWCTSGYETVWR